MRVIVLAGQRGITIIETLTVMAIIAILAGVGITTYVGQLPRARLNGAARQIMSDLMLARRQAVGRTHRVQVYFSDGQQYKVCNDADGNGTVTDCEGNAKIKDIQANYDGVTISANNNPIFQPRGTVSNWATITLSNATGSRYVTVSSAGRIRITTD